MAIAPTLAADSSALATASQWTANLATGSLATSIAILAIAGVGFALLNGRLDWRRGATTILGCFILFGAPAIATALSNLAHENGGGNPTVNSSPSPIPAVPPAPNAGYDPYAGASLVR